MNSKCPSCGLVNFSTAHECKRCGALLSAEFAPRAADEFARLGQGESAAADFAEFEEEARPRRSLMRKVLAGCVTALLLLVVFYVSLLETSTAVTYEQKQVVQRAVDLIERKGFHQDAFLLRRLANFRTSDNWWNNYLGHADAYAATNFPFEVVTLYPEFFTRPKDDTERAVILLHEARHLAGSGEEAAFRSVWRDKSRLGYTYDKYTDSQVYLNVVEYTMKYAPELFRCGPDGRADCLAQNSRPQQ
ncbi:MAG TPA: Ran-binding zinc finger domain-containing protein [Pyrinomonadaceae bacterium]